MKIGFSQITKPTPRVLRNIRDGLTGLVPFVGMAISQIPPEDISDRTKIYLGILVGSVLAFYTFFIKIIGVDDESN